MSKSHFDELLEASRPARISDAPGVRRQLSELVDSAAPRRARSMAAWRRRRILLPVAGFLIIGTTAGAAIALWAQDHDVAIPVSYTTDAGNTYRCTYGFSVDSAVLADGEPLAEDADVEALRDFISRYDWSEVGQNAYSLATDESWRPAGGLPDAARLNRALYEVVADQIPENLFVEGVAWGAGSDCEGQLR
jgi:hypothetical protein